MRGGADRETVGLPLEDELEPLFLPVPSWAKATPAPTMPSAAIRVQILGFIVVPATVQTIVQDVLRKRPFLTRFTVEMRVIMTV